MSLRKVEVEKDTGYLGPWAVQRGGGEGVLQGGWEREAAQDPSREDGLRGERCSEDLCEVKG